MAKTTIVMTAEDRTKAAFDSVNRGLGTVEGKINTLKGAFSGFSAIAATAGLTALMSEAVKAASQAEQSSNRLDAVLRATGNTSGYTRDQLDGMADALTRVTTFDDEGIREAQSTLIKFGTMHGEVFDRALKASADYAAFTGTDMAVAAKLIGRALDDPIRGVTLLEREVGRLTETQRDQIQAALEQGRTAEAQAVIFEKLEGAIGGTAGNMDTGIYGASTAAKKSYDDLMEALGRSGPTKIIVENSLLSMASVMDVLRKAIEDANKEVERSIFFNGQLKPLTPEQGGKKSGMTVPPVTMEELQAQDRALRAQQDADEERRAETAAKAAIERAKAAAKAREQDMKDADLMARMIQESYAEQQESIAATRQAEREHAQERMRSDLDWAAQKQWFADQQNEEQAQTLARMEELAAAEELARQARFVAVFDSLVSERGLIEQDFAERSLTLKEWLDAQAADMQARRDQGLLDEFEHEQQFIAARAQYYAALKQLDTRYQSDKTKIEDAAIKQRFGIANVYRKADINSAAFFSDQMAGLMQTNSRKLFELGKAGAIAGAVIDTYKAATGAYAALASIPFVGPFLGAAAAAAAIAVGTARVSAIKSTQFGGGGVAGGAVGTFNASPNTGLPDFPGTQEAPQSPITQAAVPIRRDINITIQGEGLFSAQQIRDSLIPALNDAIGDGVVLNVR